MLKVKLMVNMQGKVSGDDLKKLETFVSLVVETNLEENPGEVYENALKLWQRDLLHYLGFKMEGTKLVFPDHPYTIDKEIDGKYATGYHALIMPKQGIAKEKITSRLEALKG